MQNLLRSEHYKEDNIILVGVIPGPSEPSLTMNSFFFSLVQEQRAWSTGIVVKTPKNSSITVRLAVSCVTCDLSASRKVCGFLEHNALLGCSKCYKNFPYSGYNRKCWHLQNCASQYQKCHEILNQTTKTCYKMEKISVCW